MKNISVAALTLLTGFIFSSGNTFAYIPGPNTIQVYVDNSDIVNALNNINNSIVNATKARQDAITDQKIDSLNQECVKIGMNTIRTQDTYLKEIDSNIAEYRESMATMDMSNPSNFQAANQHLNYLYTLRGRQVDEYKQWIIKECSNYKPQVAVAPVKTNDQICKDSGIKDKFGNIILGLVWTGKLNNNGGPTCGCPNGLVFNNNYQCVSTSQACKDNFGSNSVWNSDDPENCGCAPGFEWNDKRTSCIEKIKVKGGTWCNGKYWNGCPSGQNFYCPTTGDAQCQAFPSVNANTQAPKKEILKTPIKKTGLKAIVPAVDQSEQVTVNTVNDVDSKVTESTTYRQGLIQRAWKWSRGLFGF